MEVQYDTKTSGGIYWVEEYNEEGKCIKRTTTRYDGSIQYVEDIMPDLEETRSSYYNEDGTLWFYAHETYCTEPGKWQTFTYTYNPDGSRQKK